MNTMLIRQLLITFQFLLLFCGNSFAQLNPIVDSIPMSDGRKLAADIYIPNGMSSGPVILIQTPYNRQLSRFAGLPMGIGLNVNTSNFIFVIVDWRGFYGSKNALYLGSPDRGRDGYSAVEWIAGQTWSNGKVGTWGPSALGKVQYQTAKTKPPHLVCINPSVAGPQFEYLEYYPNGALRTEYVQQLDQLGFGLSTMLMAHPYKDFTWSFTESANDYPDSISVPCFMIGGWYDHNTDLMIRYFEDLKTESNVNVRSKHKILWGPWVHGGKGIARVGTSTQGQLSYPNAENKNDTMALKFFDFYLRGIANGWESEPAVTYYQMGENKWKASQVWPPSGTSDLVFYLHKDGSLKNSKPISAKDSLNFVYDPEDPSPTIGGATLRNDLDQGPYDQSILVEGRGDILVFTTATLTSDITVKGKIKVKLKVSSDKLDTDFDIRLTDVYPDGKSILVNDAVMRMRFRNGFAISNVAMMNPGQIYDCIIELPTTSLTFLAGHKIRIDITSSNYPKYNRNMNNGGNMYPGNSLDSVFNPLVATNTVHLDSVNSSNVVFPVTNIVSIVEVENSQSILELYPNPASSSIKIGNFNLNGQCNYRITDALGKEILSGTTEGIIDIKDLQQGIYILTIETEEVIMKGKFFKEES